VRLYSIATKEFQKQAVLRGHLGVIRQVRFTPDGKELASVCDGGRVIFWSLDSKEKSREWQLPAEGCAVSLSRPIRAISPLEPAKGSWIYIDFMPRKKTASDYPRNRRMTRAAFWPPNPKLVETAVFTGTSRACSAHNPNRIPDPGKFG